MHLAGQAPCLRGRVTSTLGSTTGTGKALRTADTFFLITVVHPELQAILDLEPKVREALARGDSEADSRLLHECFLGVYSNGFSDRSEHVSQLNAGPVVSEFSLRDSRILPLGPDVVLLAYLAVFRRPDSPLDAPSQRMYVSSVWQRHPQGWLNMFSQDMSAA